jgi:hypothetical protein
VFRFANSAGTDAITTAEVGDQTVAKTNGSSTRSPATALPATWCRVIWCAITLGDRTT